MTLVKKDYGLHYNTDGSLCVTVRDDEIPFEGVKSIAIEESTQNLLNLIDLNFSWTGYPGGYNLTKELIENEIINGLFIKKGWRIKGITSAATSIFNTCNLEGFTGDKFYTGSFYWMVVKGKNIKPYFYFPDIIGDDYVKKDFYDYEYNKWYRISLTSKFKTDRVNVNRFSINTNTLPEGEEFEFIIANFQIEEKPFATSFTEGTRMNGKFEINTELNPKNFSINFWYISPNLKGVNGNRIISFNKSLTDYSIDDRVIIRTPDNLDTNNTILELYLGRNNIQILQNFDLTKWSNFTITGDENYIKVYYNGEKILETANTITDESLKYLTYPGTSTITVIKSLYISNLFMGKYKKDDETVIWTDEYIKYVYEAKKPFGKIK